MTIAVTGPDGFLAWHTRCALRSRYGGDAVLLGRAEFQDVSLMATRLRGVDAVVHLAGVNRASDDATIARVNPWLARQLTSALELADVKPTIVYGNSVHALGDSVFGQAKREAADILCEWGRAAGADVANILLPNIFGEHGRPHYNSVVTTFCHQIANGETPVVDVDRELPLLHAQRAAGILVDASAEPERADTAPEGRPTTVAGLLDLVVPMAQAYRSGDLPDLSDSFTRDLFNTYRSYTFPGSWPLHPEVNGDQRGELFETVRALGGQAQVFFSRTRPGFTRGQHYHLHKVERFLVIQGRGVIRLRKLFTDQVVEFEVSGDRPAVVDMPTMWVHSITNTGDEDLVTLFFADEVFDPAHPDTFPEEV